MPPAGTKLGPYEIQSPLGSGGMGEVYRAKDARLGREVALKILPESFARDPDRRARFEREARTGNYASTSPGFTSQIASVVEIALTMLTLERKRMRGTFVFFLQLT
jgi:serine/threonine protein kinase